MTKARRTELIEKARRLAAEGRIAEARAAFALVGISYVPHISN